MVTKKFDQAKLFIVNTLPQIWAKLDNNFLNELPPLVNCPRLTTSNLRDASTLHTAKLLATSPIPDDATVASKWSNPPQAPQQPPRAVTVNYTGSNFPSMTKHNQESRAKKSLPTEEQNQVMGPLDASSVHSHASGTSGGTTFIKEDGVSLLTSMTESLMEDFKSQCRSQCEAIKSQNEIMVEMMHNNQVNQAAQIAHNIKSDALIQLNQAAQLAHNIKPDARIEMLLTALTMNQPTMAFSPNLRHQTTNQQTELQLKPQKQPNKSPRRIPQPEPWIRIMTTATLPTWINDPWTRTTSTTNPRNTHTSQQQRQQQRRHLYTQIESTLKKKTP